jgi:hypothetical protein
MHLLIVGGVICAGLYVVIRLAARFYFPPDT